MTAPSASRTPFGSTSATRAEVCTLHVELCEQLGRPQFASRSGSAGRMRSARPRSGGCLMSFSGSMRSRPKATSWRVVRCSSAASSMPVAPAPMMATCSCSRPQRLGLRVRADAGVDETAVEARRLAHGVSSAIACSLHARRAEIVGQAADGDAPACRSGTPRCGVTMSPSSSTTGATCTCRRVAVDADHLADAVTEAMPVRLGEVVDLVHAEVHAAGRDLVQQRLPEVRALLSISVTSALPRLRQLVAEPRDQLEPARAAADHDDPVPPEGRVLVFPHGLCRSPIAGFDHNRHDLRPSPAPGRRRQKHPGGALLVIIRGELMQRAMGWMRPIQGTGQRLGVVSAANSRLAPARREGYTGIDRSSRQASGGVEHALEDHAGLIEVHQEGARSQLHGHMFWQDEVIAPEQPSRLQSIAGDVHARRPHQLAHPRRGPGPLRAVGRGSLPDGGRCRAGAAARRHGRHSAQRHGIGTVARLTT